MKTKTITAKIRIAAGIKRTLSLTQIRARQSQNIESLRRKFRHDSQTEKRKEHDTKARIEASTKTNSEGPPLLFEEGKPTLTIDTAPSFPTLTVKRQISQKMPSECLTCEKLIHCNLRSSISTETVGEGSETASCRFATEISRNAKTN